jgi:hypothetical protein
MKTTLMILLETLQKGLETNMSLQDAIVLIETLGIELERRQILEAHNTGKFITDRTGHDYYEQMYKCEK